jgi:hypothetical protein
MISSSPVLRRRMTMRTGGEALGSETPMRQHPLTGCGKTPERSRIPEAFACWGVLRGSPEGQM